MKIWLEISNSPHVNLFAEMIGDLAREHEVIVTARPLDYEQSRMAFSMEDAYYENGGYHNPRLADLVADQWFDNKLGGSLSFAYSDRKSEINRYRRQTTSGV